MDELQCTLSRNEPAKAENVIIKVSYYVTITSIITLETTAETASKLSIILGLLGFLVAGTCSHPKSTATLPQLVIGVHCTYVTQPPCTREHVVMKSAISLA